MADEENKKKSTTKKGDKKKKVTDKSIEKYIEKNPVINEAKSDTIVVSFGRFNPMTTGHEKLVGKVTDVARKMDANVGIYTSHTQDSKKNPLSYVSKVRYLQKAFGKIVVKSNARTIIEVAKELSGKYKTLVVVAGSDRVSEFQKLLTKYNGKDYDFESIQVVSAGERDPDASDVSGMSASKLRALVAEGDFEAFRRGLPKKLQSSAASKLYDELRDAMGIEEDLQEVLSVSQRRARGRTMKRHSKRNARKRKITMRRKASTEKLKKRATKKARNLIKKRLAGQKRYADLPVAQKVQIDKRLQKISKSRIQSIAKRQLPGVRKAEMERIKNMRSSRNESLDELFEKYILDENKKYYNDMSPSTAEKRKAHFNKGSGKDDDDPNAYEPAPGDASAETKPSKYTKKYKEIYGEERVDEDAVSLFEAIDHLYENDKAIKAKAKETGVSYSILKQVFDRGMAAWKSGHRPGTNPTQWGLARINSFVTGGKTQKTADADLWAKHKGMKEEYGAGEEGTDEVVANYVNDTPGQRSSLYKKKRFHYLYKKGKVNCDRRFKMYWQTQNEDYNDDDNIASDYGDFEKGMRVRFSDHSMDFSDVDDENLEGVVIGSDVTHLRVRDDEGRLYKVRHDDAVMAEQTVFFTLDESFELRFLDENSLMDRAVQAVHRHVSKGKDLENVIWEFIMATGATVKPRDLKKQYVAVHGDPYEKKPNYAVRAALQKKYR